MGLWFAMSWHTQLEVIQNGFHFFKELARFTIQIAG